MAVSSVRSQSLMFNVFCLFGLALSLYSLFVEFKKESDKDYVAYCDIDDLFACSKVFMTKYGKGFGLIAPYFGEDHFLNQPNGVYGVLLYSILLVLSLVKSLWVAKLQLTLVVAANCATPYLAYLLYKVIKAVCVVCIATYIVNAVLLILSLWTVSVSSGSSGRRSGKRKKANKKD